MPFIAATAAMLQGDDQVAVFRRGSRSTPRRLIFDDCLAPNNERSATIADIAEWARSALRLAAADEAAAAKLQGTDPHRAHYLARALALRSWQPHIEYLAARITQCAPRGGEQIRLAAGDYAGFCAGGADPKTEWMDATGAEAIFRGAGEWEIPLRAAKDLAAAIRAETAWAKGGGSYGDCPAATLLRAAAGHETMWFDATPPPQVVEYVASLGGAVGPTYAAPPNLHTVLVPVGVHARWRATPEARVSRANARNSARHCRHSRTVK